MARPISKCARNLQNLLRKNGWKRGTISADYFRELVGRSRIEESFWKRLDEYCIEYHAFAVVRVDYSKFVLVRLSDRYFPEDPYEPSEEDE